MARQSRPEHLVLISLTIGAAGFAAAALYRMLAPLASADVATVGEPLSEGMRAILEREKQLTLRAIKELEFDRAMGKVSPKDFEEMAGRLRARAMQLMKQLDAEAGYRELIERELTARLRRAPGKGTAAQPQAKRAAAAAAEATCACGTANDSDAAFCKRCGTKLVRAARVLMSAVRSRGLLALLVGHCAAGDVDSAGTADAGSPPDVGSAASRRRSSDRHRDGASDSRVPDQSPPSQTVEIIGAGQTRTAITNDSGRAEFKELPVGARLRATATVGSERLESQEFTVPANGGIRLMLVAADRPRRRHPRPIRRRAARRRSSPGRLAVSCSATNRASCSRWARMD